MTSSSSLNLFGEQTLAKFADSALPSKRSVLLRILYYVRSATNKFEKKSALDEAAKIISKELVEIFNHHQIISSASESKKLKIFHVSTIEKKIKELYEEYNMIQWKRAYCLVKRWNGELETVEQFKDRKIEREKVQNDFLDCTHALFNIVSNFDPKSSYNRVTSVNDGNLSVDYYKKDHVFGESDSVEVFECTGNYISFYIVY